MLIIWIPSCVLWLVCYDKLTGCTADVQACREVQTAKTAQVVNAISCAWLTTER